MISARWLISSDLKGPCETWYSMSVVCLNILDYMKKKIIFQSFSFGRGKSGVFWAYPWCYRVLQKASITIDRLAFCYSKTELMLYDNVNTLYKQDPCYFCFSNGHPCPMNYNPADHFILTLAIVPGKEADCKSRVKVSTNVSILFASVV